MIRFHAILFFFKVLLGMTVSLVIFATLDIRWWQDEGIIIPILLLADAVVSFYFVYWLINKFHYPLGVFSVVPITYGLFFPLVAILLEYIIVTFPIVQEISNNAEANWRDRPFIGETVIVLFFASAIALILTCLLTWLFMRIKQKFGKQEKPEQSAPQ